MTCPRKDHFAKQQANEYATVEDFRAVFADASNDLYQLSFVLTGDAEKAERTLAWTLIGKTVTRQTVFSRSGRVLGRSGPSSKMQSVN